MATAEKTRDTGKEQEEQGGNGNGSGHNVGSTAMKAALAAAATGVAALAVTKALSGSHGSGNEQSNGEDKKSSSNGGGGGSSPGSLVGALATGSWGAAQDAIVPLAEEAAGAAGTFLATSGPEIVRETILPKFIDSFNEARSGGDSG